MGFYDGPSPIPVQFNLHGTVATTAVVRPATPGHPETIAIRALGRIVPLGPTTITGSLRIVGGRRERDPGSRFEALDLAPAALRGGTGGRVAVFPHAAVTFSTVGGRSPTRCSAPSASSAAGRSRSPSLRGSGRVRADTRFPAGRRAVRPKSSSKVANSRDASPATSSALPREHPHAAGPIQFRALAGPGPAQKSRIASTARVNWLFRVLSL